MIHLEEDVGHRGVGLGQTTGHVSPIDHVGLAVLAENDVGRVEVAVADVLVAAHAVGTHLKLVALGRVKVLDLLDHGLELGALAVKKRRRLGVLDADLKVDELREDLGLLGVVGVVHELADGRARDVLVGKRPAAVGRLRDLDDLGSGNAGLGNAGEVEGLVEDVRGGLGGPESLDDLIAVLVNDLLGALDEDDLVIGDNHGKLPPLVNNLPCCETILRAQCR